MSVKSDATADLLKILSGYDVKFISELPYTLEQHFKKILIDRKEQEKNVQ